MSLIGPDSRLIRASPGRPSSYSVSTSVARTPPVHSGYVDRSAITAMIVAGSLEMVMWDSVWSAMAGA